MATRKKSPSKRSNPAQRRYLDPRNTDVKGQRGLFKYRDVYPGEPSYPIKGDVAARQHLHTQEIPLLPSDVDPDASRRRKTKDPLEDDFIYEEYAERVDEHGRFTPYRPLKHDLTTAQGGKHGLLFNDVDALYAELDLLAEALKDGLDEALLDAQEAAQKNGSVREYMEERLTSWLGEGSDEDFAANVDHHERLKSLIGHIVVLDDAGFASAIDCVRDRSNWTFYFAPPPTDSTVDWADQEEEHSVEFYEEKITVDVDVDNLVDGKRVKLEDGEDLIFHAFDLFRIIEGGDEGLAQEALELWLKDVVKKSKASDVKVEWKKPRLQPSGKNRIDREVPETQFSGYVTIEAYANMDVETIGDEMLAILDDLRDAEPDEDVADEPDVVDRISKVAKLSDAAAKLDFVFTPVVDERDATGKQTVGGDWTVWSLSPDDTIAEGKAMKHCVGDEGMRYAEAIQNKQIWMWSVKNGAGKSLFTLEVRRNTKNDVGSFKQVKGKANRLPGWPVPRDYPPYGPNAFKPRVQPYEETTRAGTVIHPGIEASDVRAHEVMLLWQLIKDTISYNFEGTELGSWQEIEDALTAVKSSPTGQEPEAVTYAVEILHDVCADMIPGLYAVFAGRLFNDPRPAKRTNPSRRSASHARPNQVTIIQGTTFDRPCTAPRGPNGRPTKRPTAEVLARRRR
jgi:hypothetical protein